MSPRFDNEVGATLGRLSGALAALVAAVPGPIRRAADLQRVLGVDAKLGWQAFRMATASNPVQNGFDVPAKRSMTRLLQAARKRRVPEAVVQHAADAFDAFEAVIQDHAGDRQSFESMLCGLPQVDPEEIDLHHRRAAFAAQSHFLGVQARTRFVCQLLKPGSDHDAADAVLLGGFISLRWLRAAHAPFVISRVRLSDLDGIIRGQAQHEPLDPTSPQGTGVSLLSDFCSNPLPRLRQRANPNGYIVTEMIGEGVGNPWASSFATGEIMRNAMPRFRSEHNPSIGLGRGVRTPCEVLLHDLLVHEDTFGPIKPEVLTYSNHQQNEYVPYRDRAADILPLKTEVKHLGRGAEALRTGDVPRYTEMIQYALDRMGWDGSRFEAFRCRVEFPIMPSSVVVGFDLPPVPSDPPTGGGD